MTPHLANTPVLGTKRLILRAPAEQDWEPFAAFIGSERSAYVGGPVTNRREAWRVFAQFVGHWALRGFGIFALERKSDGQTLGLIGPWFPEGWPEREFGWSIWEPQAEGQGYAFEAMTAVRDHAFGDLGWSTAVSYIEPSNARSIALAERLGAERDDEAARPDAEDLVYRHSPKREAA